MDFDSLNAMKYGELLKLAKEKLNITKRLSKDTLVEKLVKFHKELLNDDEFVSPDESPYTSAVETDTKQSQTDTDTKNEKPVKKGKAKRKQKKKQKAEKPKLNETFSMDEEEPVAKEASAPEEASQPPKRMKGKRRAPKKDQPQCETRADKTNKASLHIDSNIEKNLTDISSAHESELESTAQEPSVKRVKGRSRKASNKSSDDVNKEKTPVKAETKEPVPHKRTRSSNASVADAPASASVSQTETESEQTKPPMKRMKKSSSFTITSTISKPETPVGSKTEEKKRTPLPSSAMKSSKLPRKSMAFGTTPAKTIATPASTRKQVQSSTSIPKPLKAKAAPNFAELHQKQFNKMQSVDEYVEKKRFRTETMAIAKTPRLNPPVSNLTNKSPTPAKDIKFNFVSGLQKPVFTAKGQVVSEKQRVMATVKENVLNTSLMSTKPTKRKGSLLDVSRDMNSSSKLSIHGKEILKGVRTNRRFELQMQHRNMKN